MHKILLLDGKKGKLIAAHSISIAMQRVGGMRSLELINVIAKAEQIDISTVCGGSENTSL